MSMLSALSFLRTDAGVTAPGVPSPEVRLPSGAAPPGRDDPRPDEQPGGTVVSKDGDEPRAHVIGFLNLVLVLASLWCLLAAFGLAESRLTSTAERRILGIDATPTVSVLVLGAAAAFAGCMVQQCTVFVRRMGRRSFEISYAWWYALRAPLSAVLGVVLVGAADSGFVELDSRAEGVGGLLSLMVVGSLAGLFTDSVLQRLQRLLGATSADKPASEQPDPAFARRGQATGAQS